MENSGEDYIKCRNVTVIWDGKKKQAYKDENSFLYDKKTLTIFARDVGGVFIDIQELLPR